MIKANDGNKHLDRGPGPEPRAPAEGKDMRGKSNYSVVTFGLGGYHAEKSDGLGMLSGYSDPTYFERELADPERLTSFDFEGAIVIDIRAVVTERPLLAITSPMCNPRLKPGTVDKFNQRVDLSDPITKAIVNETTRTSPGLRLAVAAHKFGSLDMVAVDIYTEFWRGHGARVGRIEGQHIAWEGGHHAEG